MLDVGRKTNITFILIVCVYICYGQKTPLNFSNVVNWPHVGAASISNDGKYVIFEIEGGPSNSKICIRSVDGKFEKIITKIGNSHNIQFSEDSRNVSYLKQGDTLCIINLDSKSEKNIGDCKSFAIPISGNGQWVAYQLKNLDLILFNLRSGETRKYSNVNNYLFSGKGKVLLINQTSDVANGFTVLDWVNLVSGTTNEIWKGEGNVYGFAFRNDEKGVAFFTSGKESNVSDIWYYRTDMNTANCLVKSNPIESDKKMAVHATSQLRFSPDDRRLFFEIYKIIDTSKLSNGNVKVAIWSYKDINVQSEQKTLLKVFNNLTYLAVVDLDTKKVLRLEEDYEGSVLPPKLNLKADYLLTQNRFDESVQKYDSINCGINLKSVKDGSHTCILEGKGYVISMIRFSPGGKYLYWYDKTKKTFLTYDISHKKYVDICKNIPVPIYKDDWDEGGSFPYGASIWLSDDKGVIIYDKYDVWLVDPTGVNSPIDFTNGYGRRNKISIRCVETKSDNQSEFSKGSDGKIILVGFSLSNKTFGFYCKRLIETGDPIILKKQSSDIIYYPERIELSNSSLSYLDKARDTSIYVLKHCSSINSPNFVITSDFVNFTKLSDLNPQKEFNWLTSELIKWKTFKGKVGEGILFKPENFDPNKKYPVIFYFYQRLTNGLNAFIEPSLSSGPINIPMFVSQGYLVFCPDIYFSIGEPGESCYDYVVSAAQYLGKKTWIDKNKFGIQGHSWGGYQVDYLVTRSDIFRAAVAAAGITDYVSGNVSLFGYLGDKGAWMDQFESGQNRMGSSFWENKAGYIKNSPVLNADKVKTPLLIMHNEMDAAVPWSQGVEYYLGLRRLKKPVWMLQYDRTANHIVGGKNALDYSIRMKQFFDHYLKEAPAPIWMTKGIPARLEGIIAGYNFDPIGNCNKNCKICQRWNELYRRHPEKFQAPESEWKLNKDLRTDQSKE